jgi:hypothetical protein
MTCKPVERLALTTLCCVACSRSPSTHLPPQDAGQARAPRQAQAASEVFNLNVRLEWPAEEGFLTITILEDEKGAQLMISERSTLITRSDEILTARAIACGCNRTRDKRVRSKEIQLPIGIEDVRRLKNGLKTRNFDPARQVQWCGHVEVSHYPFFAGDLTLSYIDEGIVRTLTWKRTAEVADTCPIKIVGPHVDVTEGADPAHAWRSFASTILHPEIVDALRWRNEGLELIGAHHSDDLLLNFFAALSPDK